MKKVLIKHYSCYDSTSDWLPAEFCKATNEEELEIVWNKRFPTTSHSACSLHVFLIGFPLSLALEQSTGVLARFSYFLKQVLNGQLDGRTMVITVTS